jgi:hypothetical protein
MRNILLTFAILILTGLKGYSQFCSGAGLSNMGAITPTGAWTNAAANSGAKRYWTFTATAGCTYDFSTCNSVNTNDTYLRLYSSATGGTVLALNDDNGPFCTSNKASLSWLCSTTGVYSILMTNWSCANLSSNSVFSYRVTCAPPFNPCSSTTNISSCGTATTFTVSSGNGSYNPPATSCGFTTPGQERIFTFTPTVTGNYTISQPTSFGYIDWFYKPVSGGCNGTGWTCIDDITNANTGNGNVNIALTAGIQYYIMADPESTTGGSVTFTINCPQTYHPCSSITTISSCGTTMNATFGSGTGAYNPPTTSCGFTTPGQEIIYTFTPTITGSYVLNQTSSFGYIDYFFKPVSAGCSGTGWTCIDDLSGAVSSVSFNLTSGIQYYIMGDPETTTGGSAQFSLSCPNPPPANDNCVNATSITLPYNSGVVSNTGSTDDAPSSTCITSGSNLWYKVVGDGQEYIATTCNASTNFDTEIAVFTGACGTMTEVTCNDDDAACSSSGVSSTVSWCATYGVEYYISVGYYTTGGGFGNFRLLVNTGVGCSPLPIELLTFTGEPYNDDVLLEWSTASEYNNDYFFIEKTYDGIKWEKIKEVNATGFSTVKMDYLTIDENPRNGLNYYRLTQVDFDGQNETFEIIAVNMIGTKDCDYKFYNMSGQLIDIQSVPPGIYFKRCGEISTKFVKY